MQLHGYEVLLFGLSLLHKGGVSRYQAEAVVHELPHALDGIVILGC